MPFAVADVDDVKAVASEFGVRKRLAPRLLLFNSRARQAEVVKLTGDKPLEAEAFMAHIHGLLAENQRVAGRCQKITLAIDAGERVEL